MLGRLLLYAMAMIVGFGLAFGGIFMLAAAPDPDQLLAWSFVVTGVLTGGLCLRQVIVLNRRIQHEAWEAAVADPSSIYTRWTDDEGRELLLAKSGLFIGKNHHAFTEFYSQLAGIRVDGLKLEIELSVGPRPDALIQTKSVAFPERLKPEIEAAVADLRASLDR
ncbi:MAG: hypothetical protein AAF799_22395 [Myxococcota bacterium]